MCASSKGQCGGPIIMFSTLFFIPTNIKKVLICLSHDTSVWLFDFFIYLRLRSWSWNTILNSIEIQFVSTHKNSWCILQHFCCHYVRFWFLHGTRTIICTSFKHVQLFLSMSQHRAHQRWHLHFNQHCHYWFNMSEFISPILWHPWICCLRCRSSQRIELSRPTPCRSILLLSSGSIWIST
jgi:hypothetical protein